MEPRSRRKEIRKAKKEKKLVRAQNGSGELSVQVHVELEVVSKGV